MATSKRKRLPAIVLSQEDIEGEKQEKAARQKQEKARSERTRKLRSFHGTPDRFSLSHLAQILTSGERLEMLSAVDRLKGRTRILVELALFSNFQFVRLAAVTHLSKDREALLDIAKFCHYEDTRSSALDELANNPAALIEVACSSLFSVTRMDAVNLIKDPNTLAQIGARSPHRDSRSAAMDKIAKNPKALRKVAEDTSFRSIRISAIESLSSDIASLCSLVLSRHSEVKKAAASKLAVYVEELDDPDALIEIAKVSANEDARYIAVGRLSNDPISLKTIISESQFSDAKTTALMLLSDMVADLDDPDILSDVAALSPYPDCRGAAIARLEGQSRALLNIASNSRFKDSRENALHKLRSDVETLKSVSKLSKYGDTRKKAHAMVSKTDVFKAELSRILG